MGLNFLVLSAKFFSIIMVFYNQRSCSYTPQQNGVAEHKHKHLLAIARALLFQASLPERFLGECILTASDPTSPSCCPIPLVPHSVDATYVSPQSQTSEPSLTSLSPALLAHSPATSSSASPNSSPPEAILVQPRHSTKASVKPSWMSDFYCQLNYSAPTYTLQGFSSTYTCFVASLSTLQEPRSYKEAAASKEWREAMNVEIMALELDHYKVRLVAKGYTQVEGVNYVESFSSIAKAITAHSLLAVAAARNWEIHQLDTSRQWNQEFTSKLLWFGFVKSYHDHCLFTKGTAHEFIALLVYVDDVLVIVRSDAGISLTRTKYIHDILSDTGLLSAKGVTTPLPQDISYRVQQLSQILLHPCDGHWAVAIHLVCYLKGTPHTGLFFPSSSSLQLRAYCDADWGSCTNTRSSISGFCIFLGSALVSWKTKKQATVSRSSAEAKYCSLVATLCDLQRVSYILPTLGVSPSLPNPMCCDNKAALHIMVNPII
ncbi:UNVERIFIED_CONTAM: Retrovirus-related Pol polyprotein from transposon RE2 [Sesamum latifolium]|uniref:Retrovirus-related Pol polyprotein from transposon RE2 n=1 Tax=Sesamum latifolium TaxID=2727402 RepID=A0AAW2WW09_9LAMI